MNPGGEAADAIVKGEVEISVEVIKLAALGAKNLAALIFAIVNGNMEAKRLVQEAEVVPFKIKAVDVGRFKSMARKYKIKDDSYLMVKEAGSVYCDVIANAGNIAKINLIMERMGYAAPSMEAAQKKSVIQALSELKSNAPELGLTAKTHDRAQMEGPDLLELIHDKKALIQHPEQFRQFLLIDARARYTDQNMELIEQQRPGAGPVMSKSKWRECGRELHPDAQSIYIKAPDPHHKGEYIDVPVYEISDTVPGRMPQITGLHGDELTEACTELVKTCPVEVVKGEPGEPSRYDPERRAVVLDPSADSADLFHDLAVTTSHARMHERWGDNYQRDGAENICQCAAVEICVRYGMDPHRHDLTAAAEWVKDLDPAKEHYVSQFLSDIAHAAGPKRQGKPRSRTRMSAERVR